MVRAPPLVRACYTFDCLCRLQEENKETQSVASNTSWITRAANPSVELSVAKSDFKRSGLILSIKWSVDSENMCQKSSNNKKLWKPLHLNYAQMLWRQHLTTHNLGNIQRTSYHFSFVHVTIRVDLSFHIVHSAMGNRKVPRSRRCT